MTFAVPLFLIAALAGAIPVILHMINRQRAKELPFSTLRFLRISAEKTRRRRRIHDVLLMVVRTSALLLIALGLSKPTLTNLRTLFGGAASAVAIVLDNSASMGMIDNGRVRLETALGAATQIMDQLGDGDQIALWVTNGPSFPEQGKLDRTHEQVRQMLAQCRVSFERADVAAKVLEARKVLAQAPLPNKDVFVISDFQQLSWESLKKRAEQAAAAQSGDKTKTAKSKEEQEEAQIPIIFVDCNRTPKPNVAVQNVDLEAAAPVAGLPMKVSAELLNPSPVAQQRLVELYVDGAKEASSPVLNIPPESRVKHDFLFSFKSGGLHRGEVRLAGEDGSKFDDRRYFAMEVDPEIPVAVVKAERHEIPYLEDTFYVERALNPGKPGGWAIRTTTLTASQLPGEPLTGYKVIYCVNLPAPDDDTAARLRAYVEHGGHLVWICGDNVDPDAYNQMNQRAEGKLLPLALLDVRAPVPGDTRESWHIAFLDKQHRALAHLVEPPSLYQSVLVYKHLRMDSGKASEVSVMARLDDGEPLLVQRKIQRGTVTMLGTSGHVGWTNLPLRPIFLPMLARLTFELAGTEQARHQGLAGAPLVLQLQNEIQPVGVEVVPPSGEMIRLKTQQQESDQGQVFRYNDTHEIGIYMLRLLQAVSAKQIAYCVNVDPDEADPAKIKPEELQELLSPTPLVLADNPDDLSSTFQWLRQGRSLWGTFLAAVLIVLVFETFLSNRLSPKQEDQEQLQQLPPGMRRLAKKGRTGATAGFSSSARLG